MRQIYCESIGKLLKNKRTIESSLQVKLEIKGQIVLIKGKEENEMITMDVLKAMNLGFSVNQALDLKQEDFVFIKIPIKSISHRSNLSQVRARVVGTKRRVLNTIEDLTGCYTVLHNNSVGIIGPVKSAENAEYALRNLIRGSKHANVYRYLEEQNAKEKLGIE